MLEAYRNAIISGIWGNSNYDKQDEKQIESPRQQFLENIEDWYKKAVAIATGETKPPDAEEENRFTEEDERNPFLRPAIEATRNKLKGLPEGDAKKKTVGDVVDDELAFDQQ